MLQLINQTKAEDARKNITEYMTSALQSKPYLIEKLIPSFPVGCRRVTSSESYLACLTADNVSVITSPIRSFTSTGIELISGEIFHVDAIICATGFNTSFIPRFPLIGEGGRNLQDTWKEENGGPKAYMSCMVEGMPNYYRASCLFPLRLHHFHQHPIIYISLSHVLTTNRFPRPQRSPRPRRDPRTHHPTKSLHPLAHAQAPARTSLLHPGFGGCGGGVQ